MSSVQVTNSVHIVNVAREIAGGKPIGEALNKGVSGGVKGAGPGGPSLAELQNLQKQLESTRSQVDQTIGALKQAQAQFDAKPGCMSPSSLPQEVMNNPLQFLMALMGSFGQGEAAAPAPSGGPVKHAKAPLAGDNFGPFAAAANNRCSGHNQLFDGSNPWQKQGAARDEAALVGWAMQKTDNVQYDTDRKMFYQTEANGAKTDLMSLADLKKAADGAGGISQNNGAAFNAVGAALDQASAKAASKPQQQQAPQMPTMEQLLSMLMQFMQMLQGGGAAGGANGTQNAGSTTGASGSGSASGPGAASSSSSTGGSGSASGSGGGISTTDSSGWGKLDDMKSQIDKLASSDKQSDQLKAQQMMAQMQRMFEMISKMMEQLSQMLSKSIQAWH